MNDQLLVPSPSLCDLTAAACPVVKTAAPLFHWVCDGHGKDAFQTGYRLRVHASEPLWDSGEVESGDNFAKYAGPPLQPWRRYYWNVSVRSRAGGFGPPSESRSFQTGSLKPEDYLKTPQSMVAFTRVHPASAERTGPHSWRLDFGQSAYSGLEVAGAMELTLGEQLGPDGALVRPEPGSPQVNRRFVQLSVPPGPRRKLELPVPFKGDGYQQAGYDNRDPNAAVLCPEHLGELVPFRYCEVKTQSLEPDAVVQLAAAFPFDDRAASFACSDPRLVRVWDFCKYTIKATTPFAAYVDGDRERQPYAGDAWVNQMSHYCCAREFSLARNTMEFLFDKGVEWGYEAILCVPLMAWNDYLHTGDLGFASSHYQELKEMLFLELLRGDGLLVTGERQRCGKVKNRVGFFRDLVDWPQVLRDGYELGTVNTVANCFLHRALLAMRPLAAALGENADAAAFGRAAKRLARAVRSKLFDPATGLFVDSEGSSHSSLHANAHAVHAGLAATPRITEFLVAKGMVCSPWSAQVLLDVLCRGGAEDRALELMTTESEPGWLDMLAHGATIAMECWCDRLKPNQDWNHAWATAPLNVIARQIMGITPTAPGFRRAQVRPRPGSLTAASITSPTIRGDIKLAFAIDGREMHVALDIPACVEADTVLPSTLGGETARKLFVDGKPRPCVPTALGVSAGRLAPGHHELSLKA